MSEISSIQLTAFRKLLIEKHVTKRDLAASLGVHENGINRILSSSTIKNSRLEVIAECLGVDVLDLMQLMFDAQVQERKLKGGLKDGQKGSQGAVSSDAKEAAKVSDSAVNENIVMLLSENLKVQRQGVELLSQIMALVVKV